MLGVKKINNLSLDLWCGDITLFACDGIVNAANCELKGGSGVDGAIHAKGGKDITEQCRKLSPIRTGQCAVTDAGHLPAKKVLHTAGPIWESSELQEQSPAHYEKLELLKQSYINCSDEADRIGLRHISFPAISTGAYGLPLEISAELIARDPLSWLKQCSRWQGKSMLGSGKLGGFNSLKRITFVLFSLEDYNVYLRAMFG